MRVVTKYFILCLHIVLVLVYVRRYITQSCPLCILQRNETEQMRQEIKYQLSLFNLSIGENLDLNSLERAEDFQHLIMIGTLCMTS